MFFTISNIISFFRLLLTIPMSYFLMNQMNTEALLLGILAVLTDLADGYIARKMNQISEYGKIIDPIADKVFVGVSALCLVARGSLPIWFVVAIIARDVIILLGGFYAKSKIHFVIPCSSFRIYFNCPNWIIFCNSNDVNFIVFLWKRNV